MRAVLAVVLLLALQGCSLLIDGEIERVRCEAEGAVGPPACEVGQVCGLGLCRECAAQEACGDGVDNDCSGAIDEGCADPSAAAGAAG